MKTVGLILGMFLACATLATEPTSVDWSLGSEKSSVTTSCDCLFTGVCSCGNGCVCGVCAWQGEDTTVVIEVPKTVWIARKNGWCRHSETGEWLKDGKVYPAGWWNAKDGSIGPAQLATMQVQPEMPMIQPQMPMMSGGFGGFGGSGGACRGGG